jgi:hypothetical protein
LFQGESRETKGVVPGHLAPSSSPRILGVVALISAVYRFLLHANGKRISMSKDHKRSDTKNAPKLTAKEKKAKKAAKTAKKEVQTGLVALK